MSYTVEDVVSMIRKFLKERLWGKVTVTFQNGVITTIDENITHKKEK